LGSNSAEDVDEQEMFLSLEEVAFRVGAQITLDKSKVLLDSETQGK
jgi:hypothetical protein